MAFALVSPARVAARASAVAAPRRGSAVVVRASASEPVDRRAVLGAGLAALVTTFAAASANAIEIASQASTGSSVRRGSMPPSSSGATMKGYNMEGTKKRGLSPAAKQKKLAKAKAAILANNR